MKRSIFGLACGSMCSVAALVATSAPAYAQQAEARRDFNIPAQPLASALIEFSRQSDAVVTAPARLTRQKSAPALRGNYTPAEALRALLAGSGLRSRTGAGGSFIIERGPQIAPTAAATQPPVPGDDTATQREEIVVTGTLVRGGEALAARQVIDRNTIARSGYTRLDDLLQSQPMVFKGALAQDVSAITGLAGATNITFASGVDLRGLGPTATLTLLNGKRLAPTAAGTSVDLNMIPLGIIERVDILTDGASSLYGSDAVAGVVNLVTRRRVDGIDATAQASTVTDGPKQDYLLSLVGGQSWASGNVVVGGAYQRNGELRTEDRDFASGYGPGGSLIPQQSTKSGYLSLRQAITPGLDFEGVALIGQRSFSASNLSTLSSVTDGRITRYAAQGSLNYRTGDWTFSLDGSWSKEVDKVTLDYRDIAFVLDNRSQFDVWSVEPHIEGPLATLPGGSIRLAMGALYQRERQQSVDSYFGLDFPQDARRSSRAIYGEIFIPIIGEGNAVSWARRLQLDLSARYQSFSNTGNATTPKVSLLWEPLNGLTFLGSIGRAFRAPTLFQTLPSNFGNVVDLTDPQSTTGSTRALILTGNNPDLQPERARVATIGAEYRHPFGRFSLRYYSISYKNKIDTPALNNLLLDPGYAALVDRSPDLATISDLLATRTITYFVPQPVDPASIGALINGQLANTAIVEQDGLDAQFHLERHSAASTLFFDFAANYILNLRTAQVEGAPLIQRASRVHYPADFRAIATVGGQWGRFSANTRLNYVNSYRDNESLGCLVQSCSISSWATVDLYLAYDFGNRAEEGRGGTRVSLSVLNLLDSDPPHVSGGGPSSINIGYDPQNASPLKRFVTLTLNTRF